MREWATENLGGWFEQELVKEEGQGEGRRQVGLAGEVECINVFEYPGPANVESGM